MRIIGGRLRGRALQAPDGDAVRPTSDRARENLFNLLTHRAFPGARFPLLPAARVLDAFAGTGALGLEALSRGAAHATFLEQAGAVLTVLRRNVASLGESQRATVLAGDARVPPPAPEAADLVFLDAPYNARLTAPALHALVAAGWVGRQTLVIAEIAASEALAPAGFHVLEERRYGAGKFVFLREGSALP